MFRKLNTQTEGDVEFFMLVKGNSLRASAAKNQKMWDHECSGNH